MDLSWSALHVRGQVVYARLAARLAHLCQQAPCIAVGCTSFSSTEEHNRLA